MVRKVFYGACTVAIVGLALAARWWPWALWSFVVVGPLMALGIYDVLQKRRTILRNFPVIGHFRYLFESIRPEIMQYFVETNQSGKPLSREERSLIYQRAKGERDTLPFGTQQDLYAEGYEWINHSIAPIHAEEAPRVRVGGPQCTQPYEAAVLNVSAMSYGALSTRAVLALNGGAKKGGFYHNTGEGGISPYHLEPGGDLCWQIGTGYFGCRAKDGGFDAGRYAENAQRPTVKLIELKLSQGAKPGHGGILPAAKLTPELARIRGVPLGQDVNSPPAHLAFSTPLGLVEFLQALREGSGGKPVGFKLCVGRRREFLAICKAMRQTGIYPDFITVDGGEGGTGAAPLEFSNHVGAPLTEALIFVHNALVGFDVRKDIRVIASGKVVSGFDLARRLAIGADICNAARSMMVALGCIQALRCNSNDCPTGVATQDPDLVKGLDVPDKAERVYRYQRNTVVAMAHMLGAAGIKHPEELHPWHIHRRVTPFEVRHYGELYHYLEPGQLLGGEVPPDYARAMQTASAERFTHVGPE
jgi:glutamate synthase domain-containing protein 2